VVDYHPVLARAVSGLTTNNAHARQELYEHARAVLVAHLRRDDAQMSAPETIGERIAFEAAILRLEAEWRSIGKRRPEIAPLRDANKNPDIASLLRQPAEVWPAPDKLLIPLS
jgi:hypothetical protein